MPESLLRQVLADIPTKELIAESLLMGELVALQDQGPHQLIMHRGVLATLKSVETLGLNLHGQLGWRRHEKDNQARFYSPAGHYGGSVCLIACRGVLVDGTPGKSYFRVRPKGVRWKELLNAPKWKSQLSLALIDASGDKTALSTAQPTTLCALASLDGDTLKVYLADPAELIKVKGQPQSMQLWVNDYECIFEGELTGWLQATELNNPSLEQPVEQDFDLEENDDMEQTA